MEETYQKLNYYLNDICSYLEKDSWNRIHRKSIFLFRKR